MRSSSTAGRRSTRTAHCPGWISTDHGSSSASFAASAGGLGKLRGGCQPLAASGSRISSSAASGAKTECSWRREAKRQRVPRASLRAEKSSQHCGSCAKMALPEGSSDTGAAASCTTWPQSSSALGPATAACSPCRWTSMGEACDASTTTGLAATGARDPPGSGRLCHRLCRRLKALSMPPDPAGGAKAASSEATAAPPHSSRPRPLEAADAAKAARRLSCPALRLPGAGADAAALPSSRGRTVPASSVPWAFGTSPSENTPPAASSTSSYWSVSACCAPPSQRFAVPLSAWAPVPAPAGGPSS
mmetsp:Transcript_27461/g.78361  ORF Transcript_27461/g.78361 Transcript_27461/m.78361 type:complete len:304 (+) Transcript_27461:801-1712(+)